ncbi:S8 family serine peptidase [Planosporangium thailandense]|uniref:S8 family serine peptidase n=1 Tax=Planosporangium thailandense TaxID=765197 RepID=A0ABX0XTK5_9ACTN|nr:S53 family peptidase [Planosporangium thailandense]NJC69146.1 S8 family serine peptidase [Planosporangium thailandense]
MSVQPDKRLRRRVLSAAVGAALGTTVLSGAASAGSLLPQAVQAPDAAQAADSAASPTCVTPTPAYKYAWYHCQTPQQMRAAFNVPEGYKGDGQTIVLVDSYGSPTAAHDLQYFHDTFFPNEPNPNFDQVYPNGKLTYDNANCAAKGQSGPAGAEGWAGEANLDIEWAYAVAPHAHIVLLAVPPAETLGVQGFPNLFKAISDAIDTYPAGTVFSMSFGVGEETFGGAAKTQTARFDQVFAKGLAKGDTFLSSSGDSGSTDVSKQHRDTVEYDHPSVSWPNSSPYVTSVGGTQLQYDWTWNPQSNDAWTASGGYNPDYWQSTPGGQTEAVWNESFGPIGTGGGVSKIYSRPGYQNNVLPDYGNHRLVPDLSFPAAVNGGPLVYTSFFPACDRVGWHVYGGTSAASPQVAGIVALANQARKAANKGPVGDLNSRIYRFGAQGTSTFDDWASPFRDIVPQQYGSVAAGNLSNNQMWGDPVAGYPTTEGYDLTTGWGSPRATAFIKALSDQS